MLQIIAYTLALSVALSFAAVCAERLSAMLGQPRRFFWAATMALSILWPLGAMLWAKPLVLPATVGPDAVLTQTAMPKDAAASISVEAPLVAQTKQAESVRTQAQTQWKPQLPSSRTLLLVWAVASGLLLLFLIGTDLFLHHRSTGWRRETVRGQQVLVSEKTGPALLGAWSPKIVVPRWFLEEPATTQAMILEHEQQHIAARDPLLLRLALLMIVVVPWNLPLWWQLRRIRQAIELDCDARVLRSGAEARSYGEVLLAVTQRAGSVPAGVIAMGEPVSALEQRIRHLTTGSARYSAPRALAAVLFWAIGMGVAFALDAPALPRSPTKIAARDVLPALPPPVAAVTPSSAIKAPVPAQTVAQVVPPSAARSESTQALPSLRPPTGYSITPRDYDDPRSRVRTGDAVLAALAARPDLLAAIRGDAVISTEKQLIVSMTEDGKVDRFALRNEPIPLNDMAYGDGKTTGLAGIVPELLARQWESLGLRAEQLGQMGFTFVQEGGRDIIVHYAWPRRPGEPLSGFMPNDGQMFHVPFTYAEAIAVTERHLPGAFKDAGSRNGGVPWLLLTAQGEVVGAGYAPSGLPLLVIGKANPGARVNYYLGMSVKGRAGELPPDQVVLGWLAPEQGTN